LYGEQPAQANGKIEVKKCLIDIGYDGTTLKCVRTLNTKLNNLD
jgi:hypothetical protein